MAEMDLLSIIQIPLEDGLSFVVGLDGFPTYQFKPNAQIKSPLRVILPEKLYEFAIMATIRLESKSGGYIFSVVNPMDTIVQLGVHVSPSPNNNKFNVSLIYTDPKTYKTSRTIYSTEVPSSKQWINLAFAVLNKQITFHYNCQEMESVDVTREPEELDFDSASTLYLAQAGPNLGGSFEVSTFLCFSFLEVKN